MSLAKQSAANAKRVIEGIGPHIDALASIADGLKLSTIAKRLREQRASLEDDTFLLAVLGRFRNGKSTFLNAMLCELTHPVHDCSHGPLPATVNPTTAKVTKVDYSQSTAVKVFKFDKRHEDWSLSRLHEEGIIRRDPDDHARFFNNIEYFHVWYPSTTLQSGITILDTPGTDDIRERTEIVEDWLNRIDAAIVLLRSDVLGGEDEREFIQSLQECELRDVFYVVNRREGRLVDDDLKAESWYRIADLCHGAPRYAGQNPADQRIYFVDAKAALEGRLSGDRSTIAESGLEVFERKLSDYLEKGRRPIHVRRFVSGASAHADLIDSKLDNLIPTLQAKAEEFRAKYQSLQPRLREIHVKAERLPRIIRGYRDRVEMALMVSFQQMINDLCRDLKGELENRRCQWADGADMLGRLALPFNKKKLRAEIEANAKSIYMTRLNAWQKNPPTQPGAAQVLDKLAGQMAEEIEDVVNGISRDYAEIQFELLGLDSTLAVEEEAKSWAKGVLVGALTLVSPDYGYSAAAGSNFGSMMRGVLLHAGTYVTVSLLGGPAGWAFLAGVLVNITWTAVTAPEKLKARYCEDICSALNPQLRNLPDKARLAISTQMDKVFKSIEQAFQDALATRIATEEEGLREQMELASKSAEEKQTVLNHLQQCRQQVQEHRERLQDAIIAAEAVPV